MSCFTHPTRDHDCAHCRHAEIMERLDALAVAVQIIAEKQHHNHQEILMKVNEALDAINDETNVIADEQTKLGDRVAALIAELGVLTPDQQAKFEAIKARNAVLASALHDMAADPANPVPTPVPVESIP